MPGIDDPENLRILKKTQFEVEIGPWRQTVEFSAIGALSWEIWAVEDVVEFFGSLPAEMNGDLKHHEICRTLGVGLA